MPVPVDLSPNSDSCQEFSVSNTVTVLKVSQWRQAILSFRHCDRRRAYSVAALTAQSLARVEDSLPGECPAAGDLQCSRDVATSDAEEEDWELHRRNTGLVAKLVTYDSDRWMLDFKLRPGLRRSGAVVLNVLPGGACDRAGVQAGDRLVSMNGRQDFGWYDDPSSIKVPLKLIFMGTAGRITSEVRLVSADAKRDFNFMSDKVLGGARTSYLYQEERVFVPSLASLALQTQAEQSTQMFSLEPNEAAHLLRRAKHEAEARLRGDRREVGTDEADVWIEVSRPGCFSEDAIPTGSPGDWQPRWQAWQDGREDTYGFSESEPMEAEKV